MLGLPAALVHACFTALDATLTQGGGNPEEVLFPNWAPPPCLLRLLQHYTLNAVATSHHPLTSSSTDGGTALLSVTSKWYIFINTHLV